MKKSCDIIICIWNQLEMTRQCIDSILQNTKFPYRLILIDNASDQPTKEYLENLAHQWEQNKGQTPKKGVCLLIIRNEENVGNTAAVNQGLSASDAAFVCNLDNDTLVAEGWLTEMVAMAESDPLIGMVMPAGGPAAQPKTETLPDVDEAARSLHPRRGQALEMATVDCYCSLIKREVIHKVGLWDEAYSPGYFDDTDYSRRVINAGYKLVGARGAYVYHRGGQSFKKNNTRRDAIFTRNRAIYEQRYGVPKRSLFIVSNPHQETSACIEKVLSIARQANWVTVYLKGSSEPWIKTRHSHLKVISMSPFLFSLICTMRIFFRRQKKFHVIKRC
ncbi:MAG: glycosyltransferase family 2 protein [Candidatus Omnitrophica bacterium]|nr:glycosyltransferase family 2 protein [Candidatus Omnitrophota bacterium]